MKKFFIFQLLLIGILMFNIHSQQSEYTASVYYSKVSGKFKVVEGKEDPQACATAKFVKNYEKDGWDRVYVSSYQGEDKKYPDYAKAYGMGYLEGILTYDRIYNFYVTMVKAELSDTQGKMPPQSKTFLMKNLSFMKYHAAKYRLKDVYWDHEYNIYMQLAGMLDGYNSKVGKEKQINMVDFQLLGGMSDFGELKYYKTTKERPDFDSMSTQEKEDFIGLHSHCSSLIKLAPDFSDLWFGHNTWSSYNEMARMFKEYRFKTNAQKEKSNVVAFSSYAGSISSTDDFFVTDADLFVMETTNSIFKNELYDQLNHQSLLTWTRSVLANRLAGSSKEWVDIFSKENSGTCNNQFQILDLKLIDLKNKRLDPGAFYVLEQTPGEIHSEDLTETLKNDLYWPSFNCAYFKSIRERSGYEEQIKKDQELINTLDHEKAARAQILKRDQEKVVDVDSFKKLLRYNDFENDKLSLNNPVYALAARYDLRTNNTNYCYGAVDAKFTSYNNLKGQTEKLIYLVNGPTNDQQPTFVWPNSTCISSNPKKWDYTGQVEEYDFEWIEYKSEYLK